MYAEVLAYLFKSKKYKHRLLCFSFVSFVFFLVHVLKQRDNFKLKFLIYIEWKENITIRLKTRNNSLSNIKDKVVQFVNNNNSRNSNKLG